MYFYGVVALTDIVMISDGLSITAQSAQHHVRLFTEMFACFMAQASKSTHVVHHRTHFAKVILKYGEAYLCQQVSICKNHGHMESQGLEAWTNLCCEQFVQVES